MRMSYLTILIIISCHVIKSDNLYNMESLLRQIKSTKKGKHPVFEENMPRKVRAARGENVFLTCCVKHMVNETVSWIRSRDLHILTVDDDVYTSDRRFQILINAPAHWLLKINNVQFEDTGSYECQINTQPISTFSVFLTVYDLTLFVMARMFSPFDIKFVQITFRETLVHARSRFMRNYLGKRLLSAILAVNCGSKGGGGLCTTFKTAKLSIYKRKPDANSLLQRQ